VKGVVPILVVLATPVGALTPLPPCDRVVESGMTVSYPTWLGENSGVVVEYYAHTSVGSGDSVGFPAAPVASLENFYGIRAVHCASGRFFVFKSDGDPTSAAAALAATEFLRTDIKAGRAVSAGAVRRAASAVFDDVIQLRETEETCGCANFFPSSRPANLTPNADRTN
jgi:hypothetical protein